MAQISHFIDLKHQLVLFNGGLKYIFSFFIKVMLRHNSEIEYDKIIIS